MSDQTISALTALSSVPTNTLHGTTGSTRAPMAVTSADTVVG